MKKVILLIALVLSIGGVFYSCDNEGQKSLDEMIDDSSETEGTQSSESNYSEDYSNENDAYCETGDSPEENIYNSNEKRRCDDRMGSGKCWDCEGKGEMECGKHDTNGNGDCTLCGNTGIESCPRGCNNGGCVKCSGEGVL